MSKKTLSRIAASSLNAVALGGLVLLGACAVDADSDAVNEGEDLAVAASALSCTNPVIDKTRSLFVTDATVLAKFPFKAVMDKIIASAGTGARQTSLALYQQWWDLNNDTANAKTSGPHCDSIAKPFDCARQEGALAATNPFTNVGTNPDSYLPLALVNRFDLAPKSGANCGEYRVVYGKVSGKTQFDDRNLIIFEAKLPNPQPSLGIEGCRPVAQFWADQSSVTDATVRATNLQSFYFTGLSGFAPVIDWSHYRGSAVDANAGQIRTNQFMNRVSGQNWMLREYRLEESCPTATSCTLVMQQASVKQNPKGSLFAQVAAGGGLTAFQTDFVNNQMPLLAGKTIGSISSAFANSFNAFQSDEQSSTDDYASRVPAASAFENAIQAKLTSMGSTLTPTNILDRATTQTCSGCHQVATGRAIGGSLTWPLSNGFTQITENGTLSPALTKVGGFLDIRKGVLVTFLCPTPAIAAAATAADSGSATLGGGSTVH